jgi:hypothetical protein
MKTRTLQSINRVGGPNSGNFINRKTRLQKMIRKLWLAIIPAALLLAVYIGGCKNEDLGVNVNDATAPKVIATYPANKTTGVALSKSAAVTVALNTIITASFDKEMDPLTITTTTFTIAKPDSTPIQGTVAYTGPGFTATFVLANSLAPNTTYTATITTGVRDRMGNALESNYVWTFTTGSTPDLAAPIVSYTDPANASTSVAFNKKIAVTFSKEMNASTITTAFASGSFILTQGGNSVLGSVTYSGLTATFTASSNLTPNTFYTGTITTGAKDLAGNPLANNYVWSFTTGSTADITAPVVSSTDPLNLATGVAFNKKITVSFSEAMDAMTISGGTFTLKQGSTPISGNVVYSGSTAIFMPSNSLAPNTLYTGTVTTGVKDLAGNPLAANYVWSFTTGATTDLTAPTVNFTDPANAIIGVDIAKKIAVTFSEAMDVSTMTAAVFTLTQGTNTVQGAVSYSGTTATFTPTVNLSSNTVYVGTITTGAKDLAGNPLASVYVWSFTTGLVLDVTAPTVNFTDPLNAATGVNLNKLISVGFSETMNAATITTATFTVMQSAIFISGTVTYVGTTAMFTPSSNLAPSTTYTGTITTGVKDAAGNRMASNYTWSFTTAASDVIPPTVISTDPVDLATGVALNKKVTATFSELMNSATIGTSTFTLKQGVNTVSGGVTLVGTTATFTPSADLAANTTYTATITTGAKDVAGNALINNFVWSFTTAVVFPIGQSLVPLGTSARFAILSNSAITNIPTSAITGDVGISPGARASITGLTIPEVTGGIYAADDAAPVPAMLIAAKSDAQIAFINANAAVRGTPTPVSGNINGLTLVPGLYESGTSIEISPGGKLYLDAGGNVNAVFIIRSATSITTSATSEVILAGGANAANIFWTAGSAITLGTNSKMKGTMIAGTSISLLTGARLDGRALIQGASAGQVSLDQSTIVKP